MRPLLKTKHTRIFTNNIFKFECAETYIHLFLFDIIVDLFKTSLKNPPIQYVQLLWMPIFLVSFFHINDCAYCFKFRGLEEVSGGWRGTYQA